MKILKKIFKKKIPGGDKLKHPVHTKLILPRVKIKPKQGRWCDVYEGRLPYPIECQWNKLTPIGIYVKFGKVVQTHDRSICVTCKRSVERDSWKMGDWEKIKTAIANAEDLRDMDPPKVLRRI